MAKRRWPVLLGPPLILVAAFLVVLRQHGPVEAARPFALKTIGTCALSPASGGAPAPAPMLGSWWKRLERLDSAGTLLGHRALIGQGGTTTGGLDLPPESSVSGPVGGLVVVVADDGSRSTVRLISAASGCGLVIHETDSVVRTAILDGHDGSVLAHLVERGTRADLGTWRLALRAGGGSDARLVAPPLDAAAGVGTVWATVLRLDADGSRLAVQSCADLGCLTRVFDLGRGDSGAPVLIRGLDEGPLLGFAGSRLVTWGACPGYPCPVLAWDLASGRSRVLLSGAGAAGLTANGRRLVAAITDASGSHLVEVDPASGRASRLRGLAPGVGPLVTGPAGAIGLEVADDEIAIASAGAEPESLNPDTAAEEVLP
jgi:hypothetical protein